MAYIQAGSHIISLYLTAGALVSLVLPWVVRLPVLSIALLHISLIAGQLLRVPLPGQGGGLLPSDFAAVCVLLAALARLRVLKKMETIWNIYTLCIVLFALWSLFTLMLNPLYLSLREIVPAWFYWIRLMVNLLLIPALVSLFLKNPARKLTASRLLLVSIFTMTTLGFIQLAVFPSLSGDGGWDPHQNRLIATWLDPNFMGTFLSLGLLYVLAAHSKRNGLTLAGSAMILLALILTQSRSALIALIITLLLLAPAVLIRMRPAISLRTATLALTLGLLVLMPPAYFLQERLLGLLTRDATVHLRAAALSSAWRLAADHAVFGVGYNAYQYAARQAGLISDFSIHSRAGADNSMLTIWVTAGLPGLVLFLTPWLLIIQASLKRWFKEGKAKVLAVAASIVFLLINSQFINSFLYSHILIFLALIISVSWAE